MGHIIYIINDITCELQKTTFKLLITPDAMLAAPLFFYAGFSLSFFSGIFSTSIGNTKVSDLLQTKARCVFPMLIGPNSAWSIINFFRFSTGNSTHGTV